MYTLYSFAKAILDYVAFFIPFYTEANILLVLYLGFGGGATIAYAQVLKPLLKEHEAAIDEGLAKAQAKVGETAGKASAAIDQAGKEVAEGKTPTLLGQLASAAKPLSDALASAAKPIAAAVPDAVKGSPKPAKTE